MGIFRKFWKRDRGASSRAIATGDVVREPAATPQQVSFMALAEASATGQKPLSPWKLPEPPPFIGSSSAAMALDRAGGPGIADIYNWAVGGAFSEGLGFLGYQYLAELSQRPEYRRVSEIWAAEATRKWIKLNGNQERIDAIEKQLKKFNIRDHFRRLAELDGFFGRAQLFVDLGRDIGDPELQKPLVAKAKVKPGSIRNFKVIEPFWSYPGSYQSANPLAPDFYVPRQWFVMAGEVHSSRLLTIVGREMPDMLKPAYSFGGLALSQMIKPYVDNWLRTRQSVSDLIHSFSTPVLETDMATVLMGGTAQGLITRLQLMNQTRDNRGVFAINKDSEAFHIEATPLSGLEKLQAQAQEQIASVSGIPLVVLLGVTPSGLNASADGEIQTFYATIKAYQERVFRRPLERIIELVQRDLDGTVDDRITFEFIDLWETPEAEKAAVRKSDADMDVAYVGAGIVSNEEVRRRIVQDEDSPYYGAELDDDAPEMPGMGEELDEDGNPIPDGPDDDGGPGDDDGGDKPGQAQDAAWEEGKHPRAKNGQFGSGGGGASAGKSPGKPEAKPVAKGREPISMAEYRKASRELQERAHAAAKNSGLSTAEFEKEIADIDDAIAALERRPLMTPEEEAQASKPAAKPPHPKVAAILGEQGVAKLREMIADPKSKAKDILAALKPLDDAQREMTPTLPHDTEPDEAARAKAVETVTAALPAPGELPSPKTARQPWKSWEEVEKLGAEAQEHFDKMLLGIADKLGLNTSPPPPDKLPADFDGAALFRAPMKSKARGEEKVKKEYDGDYSQLKDVVRATIGVKSIDDMAKVVDELKAAGLEFAYEPKNNYAKPTPAGYRDLNTLVRLPNGTFAELQINTTAMLVAKATAHKPYEDMQKLQRKNGSDEPTPEWDDHDRQEFADVVRQQQELYGAAWAKL